MLIDIAVTVILSICAPRSLVVSEAEAAIINIAINTYTDHLARERMRLMKEAEDEAFQLSDEEMEILGKAIFPNL